MVSKAGDSEFIEAALIEHPSDPEAPSAFRSLEGCVFLDGAKVPTNRPSRDQDAEIVQPPPA
jgi:hypothetical protein